MMYISNSENLSRTFFILERMLVNNTLNLPQPFLPPFFLFEVLYFPFDLKTSFSCYLFLHLPFN